MGSISNMDSSFWEEFLNKPIRKEYTDPKLPYRNKISGNGAISHFISYTLKFR
jgi:hypothetical protein